MAYKPERGRTTVPPPPTPPRTTGHPGAGAGGQRRTARPKKTTTRRTARVVRSEPTRSSGGSRRKTYRSSGGSSNSRRRSSSDDGYRRQSLGRRATGSSKPKPVRKTTPTVPTKPTAKVIKPVAPPKPPGNATWLRSDSTYQRQMAAYQKALADYQADQTLQRTDYDQGYATTRRDIGLAKEDALEALENDYAARGLLRSSLYNTDMGELNQQYQNQYTDLDKQRTAFLDQLTQGLTGFKNEQSVQQQNAQAEALRRRAERYNL